MKIIDQLTDNTFVVEIEQPQFKKEHRVVVAHDYVMFWHTTTISTDHEKFKGSLRGSLAFCSNMLQYDSRIQIPIKIFSEGILPMLNEHEYCKPEHYNNYGTYENIVTFFKDGKKMVTIFDEEEGNVTMPYSVYMKLGNKN